MMVMTKHEKHKHKPDLAAQERQALPLGLHDPLVHDKRLGGKSRIQGGKEFVHELHSRLATQRLRGRVHVETKVTVEKEER